MTRLMPSHLRLMDRLVQGPASIHDLIDARYLDHDPPPQAKRCVANLLREIRERRPDLRIREVYVMERVQ